MINVIFVIRALVLLTYSPSLAHCLGVVVDVAAVLSSPSNRLMISGLWVDGWGGGTYTTLVEACCESGTHLYAKLKQLLEQHSECVKH